MPEWIVPAEDAGKKLIFFLSQRMGEAYSARALKRSIEQNACLINKRTERFASTVLGKGDHVQLHLEVHSKNPMASLRTDQKRIIYEDNDLFIYDKPAGINSDEKGILNVLHSYNSHLQLIHRLDRDTTGLLLLAKSPLVFSKMVDAFRQMQVEKCYLALCDGVIEKREGTIDNYLGKKHTYQGQTIWGSVNKDKGVHAHTDWIKSKTGERASLIYCFPRTGRTHQIRVHLAEMGHPILGDFQYSKRFQCSYRPNRYLLHAYKITFPHPMTGKKIDIQAPLPEDFIQALSIIKITP